MNHESHGPEYSLPLLREKIADLQRATESLLDRLQLMPQLRGSPDGQDTIAIVPPRNADDAQRHAQTKPTQETSNPRHFLSEDDVKRLGGLTVSEHLRYRLTGELPDAAEHYACRTFMSQTRYDHLFGRNLEDDAPKTSPYRGLPKNELNAMNYSQFKAWSLMESAWLTGQIKKVIAAPQAAGRIDGILERVTAWRDTHNSRSWPTDCSDRDFCRAAAGCQSLARPIINSSLPNANKARLIEAVALAHRPVTGHCPITQEMIVELMNNRTELCALLVSMPTSGYWAMDAVHLAWKRIKEDEPSIIMAGAMLLPLANRLSQQCEKRLAHMQIEIASLNFMLSCLESMAKYSGDSLPKKMVGPHLLEAADILAKVFINYHASPKRESLNHNVATECIRLLSLLYFSSYSDHGHPPAELGPFLNTLFKEKFKHYEWIVQVRNIIPGFNQLAEACNLDTSSRLLSPR